MCLQIERATPVRYNIDVNLNRGLPCIFSEYHGPHTFSAAKQTVLARLDAWREESLAEIQAKCPATKLAGRRLAIAVAYNDYRLTVSNWCRRDVDRKEQDAIAGPLSAIVQALPRDRRHAVFAEIMQAVCRLDSADLQRLSGLIEKMSDSIAQPEVDGNC